MQSNNVAEDVNYFVMCKNWFPLSLWPCKTLSVKVLDYALVILLCIIIVVSTLSSQSAFLKHVILFQRASQNKYIFKNEIK